MGRVPGLIRGRHHPGGRPAHAGVEHVRVEPRQLRPVRVHQAARDERALETHATEEAAPPELERALLVEARDERVPRDVRSDHVHPRVARGRDPLDAAAVRAAVHADPRVAGLVELGLGLRREPVDQGRYVTRLVVGGVDLHRAARLAEAARVPGQHVVAGLAQRTDAHAAEQLLGAGVLVGLPAHAPPRADQHRRRPLAGREARGGEEVHADRRLVERADGRVPGLGSPRERAKADQHQRNDGFTPQRFLPLVNRKVSE